MMRHAPEGWQAEVCARIRPASRPTLARHDRVATAAYLASLAKAFGQARRIEEGLRVIAEARAIGGNIERPVEISPGPSSGRAHEVPWCVSCLVVRLICGRDGEDDALADFPGPFHEIEMGSDGQEALT